MTEVRTRFAPSPTGFMHLGGVRTALYAYLFAKKNGGKFILRIEDTDQERFVEGATEVIYDTLKGCGMDWDEGPDVGGDYGPYVQSERKHMYLPYAQELVEKGAAYYCFCTKEELDERRAAAEAKGEVFKYDKHCLNLSKEEIQAKLDAGTPYVIRLNCPTEGESAYDDEVFGHISFPNSDLDDMVLIKQDGMPTYNFANVIDDHLMGITHVVRGSEYLSSSPKYNLLYEGFGWDIPKYVHCSPVMRDAHNKMSKRHGDPSYEDLLEKGYLREAVVNYVALLGWSPRGEREIYSIRELAEAFDLAGISKSPAVFDIEKLTYFNSEYIRALSPEEFACIAEPYIREAVKNPAIDAAAIAGLLQQRTEILTDIPGKLGFFDALPDYDTELYVHKKSKTDKPISLEMLKVALPVLEAVEIWDDEHIHAALVGLAEQLEVKNAKLMWPVRIAVTGTAVTPGGAVEICRILGKEETLRRMRDGMERLA